MMDMDVMEQAVTGAGSGVGASAGGTAVGRGGTHLSCIGASADKGRAESLAAPAVLFAGGGGVGAAAGFACGHSAASSLSGAGYPRHLTGQAPVAQGMPAALAGVAFGLTFEQPVLSGSSTPPPDSPG